MPALVYRAALRSGTGSKEEIARLVETPRASVDRGEHREKLLGKVEHLGEREERAGKVALVANACEAGPGSGTSVGVHSVSVFVHNNQQIMVRGVFSRD